MFTPTIRHGVFAIDIPSRASTSDSNHTKHTKDRDAPEKGGDKPRGNGAAAATAGISPTHREASNGQRQTKAESVRKGDSKKNKVDNKAIVASGPGTSTSKRHVDKPSKEKMVANGRETTGTKNIKISSGKTTGSSTVLSLSLIHI